MTHIDAVHERVDVLQSRGAGIEISPWPAIHLFWNAPAIDGAKVFETYGLLYHWTTRAHHAAIEETGLAPGQSGGVYLTPSRYSAYLAPYRLGLMNARDVCIGVDVSPIQQLWGPGKAPNCVPVWNGGGLEFFCAEPIPAEQIRSVTAYDVCGELQWP